MGRSPKQLHGARDHAAEFFWPAHGQFLLNDALVGLKHLPIVRLSRWLDG